MVKTHPFLAGELYEPLQFLTLFVRKLHDLVDQSYPMVNPFSIIFPSLLLEQVLTFGKKKTPIWRHGTIEVSYFDTHGAFSGTATPALAGNMVAAAAGISHGWSENRHELDNPWF